MTAQAWEEGARWCWDRSDYTEEELQAHLDESNPYLVEESQERPRTFSNIHASEVSAWLQHLAEEHRRETGHFVVAQVREMDIRVQCINCLEVSS